MATVREFFESDLAGCLRLHCSLVHSEQELEVQILYELPISVSCISIFIPGRENIFRFTRSLLRSLQFGATQLNFGGKVTLPRDYPGEVRVENKPGDFSVLYRMFGDPKWRSTKDVAASARIFIYSEADLSEGEVLRIQEEFEVEGKLVQFRSGRYVSMRTAHQRPKAFICHDSRDKDAVARPIALALQKWQCGVWYDEFSLKIGDNLRESIEKGLKECKKCVLVLSSNFFQNKGWSKREFDSVFTREILEGKNLVLPVWHKVTKEQVFEYSPSLLNIKGINWGEGEDTVLGKIHTAITRDDD